MSLGRITEREQMAGKKSTIIPPTGTPRLATLGRAGTLLAPFALSALRRLLEDPKTQQWVQEQLGRFTTTSSSSPDGMLATIAALRTDVRFLAESADDAGETARAQAWTKQLDKCEQAAQLLKAPGATAKQRRALHKRLRALHAEIFDAALIEKDEDARSADDQDR
eukprot:Nk52_evm1s1457 gene=Nk52_evmTU1s1457